MKPAVVRPVVVLAPVAAAWAQAPAATAAKGRPAAKRNASAGVNFTKDGRTEVFSSAETDLATGEVPVFEVVREFDNLGLLVHERRSDTVDVHVVRFAEDGVFDDASSSAEKALGDLPSFLIVVSFSTANRALVGRRTKQSKRCVNSAS
jgi:hypothetical protein